MTNTLTDEQRAWIKRMRGTFQRVPDGTRKENTNAAAMSNNREEWAWEMYEALSIIDTLTTALEAERGKVEKLSDRLSHLVPRLESWADWMVDCNENEAIRMKLEAIEIMALLRPSPEPGADHVE